MIADPVTTITLTAGTPQSVKFASNYPYYWIDNKTSGNVYARIGGTPTPDADGTFTIAAGSQLRISGGPFDNDITLLGGGKVQIIASEIASCPFKLGSKGGGNEISGAPSYSVDAVEYPLLGLNLYGRSVQDGKPTPDVPVDIVSVGDNGFDIITKDDTHFNLLSIRDNGNGIITKQPVSVAAKVGGKFSFTVNANGDGLTYLWQWSADGTTWKNTSTRAATYNNTASASYNGYKYRCIVTDSNGNIEMSNEAIVYVISDNCEVKTASIATDALPWCGIPVSEGGNYVDSTGQQWICDTLICNTDGTGKIVKHTEKYTFTGNENLALRGNSSAYIYSVSDVIKYKHYSGARIISNKYSCVGISDKSETAISNLKVGETSLFYNTGYLNDHIIYFGSSCTTLEDFKSEIAGSVMIYPLATPQEIELTAAEISALKVLQTFDGTTSISNSANAEMYVKYCTDKSLSEYVIPIITGLQKQIDALNAAILSMGGNI